MAKLPLLNPVIPFLGIVLGVGIAIGTFLLVVLVEAVTLKLLRWGDFKRSVKASLWMNSVSTVLGLFLSGLVGRLGFPGIIILWILSMLIEAFVLFALHWREDRLNIIAVVAANTATYVVVIIPAYLLSKGMFAF